MNTLQKTAQELVDRIADLGASPLDWAEYTALEKALADEQAQAVEPADCDSPKLCRINRGCAGKYGTKAKCLTPPPAGEQIDWQDMYLKQKSEKEAMAAKYEKDIGPLARVEPATVERAGFIKRLRENHLTWRDTIDRCVEAANMLEADAGWEQVARAQDAKLQAMVGSPGSIEKLREVLDKAKAQQVAVPAGWALVPIDAEGTAHKERAQ